ncbi:hypothetical protein Tsubulata_035240 [Turnera subulata]|uniref:Uncharacterized protein n=1 Tax=Turnera subulata TaxID=218843 RepID=A0A9Q0FV38_9ROSI|nr:hypothetical protein Tsubulata_035240 [Turnera subulata]
MGTTGSSSPFDLTPPWKKHSEEELVGGCVLDGDWNQFVEKFVLRAKRDHPPKVRKALIDCGYYKEILKSKGFEVPEIPLIKNTYNYLYPTDAEEKFSRFCARYAASTIGAMKNMKLELVEIVRANMFRCFGKVFFLTFTVREKLSANQTPETYQAIVAVERGSSPDKYRITVAYIRLKPEEKQSISP